MDLLYLLPFLIMVILLLLSVPIAFSIGWAGILGILLIKWDLAYLAGIMGMVAYSTVASYILTAVPMFILMAFLASSGGLAEDLYKAASAWFGHIRGGLAIGTCLAVGIFGAMSGVSMAAATVMTQIALPQMRRIGYSDILSAGVVGVGATTDILIPPSVAMVVYGIMTDTSVGKLLLAGIVPGIMVLILLVFTILIWVTIRPQDAPRAQRTPWSERLRSLWHVWPSLFIILMVIVLLYAGVCTPTEVGAIGAFLVGVTGIILGRLKWGSIVEAFKKTICVSAMIFMILVTTFIFSSFMTLSGVPQEIMAFVSTMQINRWVVIGCIVVGYFFISMFMDEIPLMMITLQLTFPLIISLNFDPIWFGVISALMIMMGLLFPPVGMIAFVVSAISKIELHRVYIGTSIMMISVVLTVILLFLWPEIALWLPSTMR